jgi:hypothetical protein
MFNVARNPVTKRHDRRHTPARQPRQRVCAALSQARHADIIGLSQSLRKHPANTPDMGLPMLLRVDANGTTPRLDHAALARAMADLPPGAPVVILVHGFRYNPGTLRHCPHRHILSLSPRRDSPRAISWPRHLRLERTSGLALGFGWNARGTLWQAAARTPAAACALAEVIRTLRRIDPHRTVDAMAHSLGARVTLAALHHLAPGDIGRVLLLSPADLRPHAEAALATPAGQRAEVVNVTCRANAMFDFCVETLLSARLQTSVAQGLSKPTRNWTDVVIDNPATEVALARLGFPLRPAAVRICHWQPYLRPGLFALYRALFSRDLAPTQLRVALAQSSDGPRHPALPLTGVPA